MSDVRCLNPPYNDSDNNNNDHDIDNDNFIDVTDYSYNWLTRDTYLLMNQEKL